ncbi:MAG: hypothetical protein AB1918_09500 [Pseudomonadota bacterium]
MRVAFSAIVLMLPVVDAAHAGVLKGADEYAKPQHFFDWRYAQKVWFEMSSRAALEAEEASCLADFGPWLESHKENPRKAFADLKNYADKKRRNIQRCYDIQLAYDQWWDQVWSPWYNGYSYEAVQAPIHNRKAATFDDYLAVWSKRASCTPDHFLNECGPVPDWRDEEDKANAQAMMRKAAEEVAAKRRRK